MDTVKTYYRLTKPGIVYGNAMTVIAGFLLASRTRVDLGLFVATLVGICLIMASACVYNNYIDRGIDKYMKRTKKRALVTNDISGRNALIYATALGIAGFALLAAFTNFLTVLLGAIAIVMYVIVYGYAKRHSVHGTLVGSIPGALPPVAGYTAVTDNFDMAALLLFLILVAWQMPHFYAIAMYRRDDYANAGIPVLPVKKGMHAAKVQIVAYVVCFLVVAALLTFFGFTGVTYLIVMSALSVVWLAKGFRGFRSGDDVAWARGMFGFSLVVLLVFSALISVDVLLP